jgi:hypothetical protein
MRWLVLEIVAVVLCVLAACESRSSDRRSSPDPKPSAGIVSSNDKVSDAGPDAR